MAKQEDALSKIVAQQGTHQGPPTQLGGTPQKQRDMEAQAIPLDSPVIKALRDFTTQAAQAHAVAVVVVSMSQSGNIGMAAVTPGGYVQGYGLLQQAIILMQGQQVQQQGPR